MIEAQSLRHVENSVLAWDRILLYFTRRECSECRRLGTRIGRLAARVPELEMVHVDLDELPSAAGRYLIFDVPGLALYIRGKPELRYSGGIDYAGLRSALERLSEPQAEP